MHPRCQVRSSCRQGWCRVFMHTPKPFKGQAMGSCMLSYTVVEHLWTGTWRVVNALAPPACMCMTCALAHASAHLAMHAEVVVTCMDGRYHH